MMEYPLIGTVQLYPGFHSKSVFGHWQLKKGLLDLSQADIFGFVYNGKYELDFSGDRLILRSEKTTLYCHKPYLFSDDTHDGIKMSSSVCQRRY